MSRAIKHFIFLITLLLAVVILAAIISDRLNPELIAWNDEKLSLSAVFPDTSWETRTPLQANLDPQKLDAIKNYLGGRGFISRNGYQVYTWGDHTSRGDIASAAKPFYSHFLFQAIEDGLLPGLDEKVINFEPCLNNINASLDFKDRNITFRHLANQTSVYQLQESPGTTFAYNDWQSALFFDTLMLKLYGAPDWSSVDKQVFHPRLTSILQMEDEPTMTAFGINNRPGRMAISPRDHARFGLLYLREGAWKDQQILSTAYARMAVTSPLPLSIPRTTGKLAEMCPGQRTIGSTAKPDDYTDHHGSYSWFWWINGIRRSGIRMWPDAPLDAYASYGHHGKRGMAVFPSLDIVISWNDTVLDHTWWVNQNEDPHPLNKVFNLLSEADLTPVQSPLPGQIITDPQNPSWLVYNRDSDDNRELDPFFLAGPGDPEDFLYRGTRNADGTRAGDQMAIINKLKGTGANSIYLQVIRSHGGDGEPDHNPFIESDPSQGINPSILNQWETWLSEMDNNGIVTYLFLYDDAIKVSKNLDWPLDDSGNLHPGEKAFIETIVDKFKHHKHLIWSVMEEVQEMGNDYVTHTKKIAKTIQQTDNHNHVIAIHKLTGLDFNEFADDPNIDQFAIQAEQSDSATLHGAMVKAWNNAAGRYNLNMSESAGHKNLSGATLRQMNWAIAMGGAYVMVLGMDVAETPVTDLEDLGRLRKFMELTDFNKMAPSDSLAHDGTLYVLAQPGQSYIAYANNLTGNIGIKNLTGGIYDFTWFDTVSGQTIIQSNINVSPGNQSWSKPTGFGLEVAVHLKLVAVTDY